MGGGATKEQWRREFHSFNALWEKGVAFLTHGTKEYIEMWQCSVTTCKMNAF